MVWTKFLFPPKHPKIYVTTDTHRMRLKPTFSTDLSTRFYQLSKNVPQDLSKDPRYILILLSSLGRRILWIILRRSGRMVLCLIILEKLGGYLGLDDKFGFSPTIEWPLIWLVRKVITLIYDK